MPSRLDKDSKPANIKELAEKLFRFGAGKDYWIFITASLSYTDPDETVYTMDFEVHIAINSRPKKSIEEKLSQVYRLSNDTRDNIDDVKQSCAQDLAELLERYGFSAEVKEGKSKVMINQITLNRPYFGICVKKAIGNYTDRVLRKTA